MKPDLFGGPAKALTESLLGQGPAPKLPKGPHSQGSFSAELSGAISKVCPDSDCEQCVEPEEPVESDSDRDHDASKEPALQAASSALLFCAPPRIPAEPVVLPVDGTVLPASLALCDPDLRAAVVPELEPKGSTPEENAAGMGLNCLVKDAVEVLRPGNGADPGKNVENLSDEKSQSPSSKQLANAQTIQEFQRQLVPGGSQDPSGTFAAQEQPPMNQVQAIESSSPAAPEKLSGAELARPDAERPGIPRGKSLALPAEVALASAPIQFVPEHKTATVGSSSSVAPTGALPMIHSIINEVRLLGAAEGSSIAVVLKPDAQTEVRLRLEYRDGKVEAAATCERGDFTTLNAHWPELRRALEVQGVSLSELERGGSNMSSQQDGRRQSDHSSEPTSAENFPAKPFKPETMQTSRVRVPVARSANRLLESWA